MKLLPILAVATAGMASPSFADDTAQIDTAITSIAAGADRHDWDRARGAFADEVTLDYTSLWGGEPAMLTVDDVIAQWSGFLP
ncbi:nuclear transport factor 2 family protein [Ruegeria arenilitoris]|uniref:nuclear transport factor 2 family protein n=1 Tax=Ruegeria arenilitoris TaxID=1173585 RepID=UPI0020C250DE|nr:nuclear transport factor 2 family protein [Ruegeria arenilitoris]